MILHCITFRTFLTTNLPIGLSSFSICSTAPSSPTKPTLTLICRSSLPKNTRGSAPGVSKYFGRRMEITAKLFEMELKLVEENRRRSDGTRQLVSEMEEFATSSERQHTVFLKHIWEYWALLSPARVGSSLQLSVSPADFQSQLEIRAKRSKVYWSDSNLKQGNPALSCHCSPPPPPSAGGF